MLATSKSISGFDPRSIPGCALWLDAADTGTITSSSGSVSQWVDKASGLALLQATASNQPTTTTLAALNNLPVMAFSNATATRSITSSATTTSTGAHTMFMVLYLTSGANVMTKYGIYPADLKYIYTGNGTLYSANFAGSAGISRSVQQGALGSVIFASNTPYLMMFSDRDATTSITDFTFRINGTTSSTLNFYSSDSNVTPSLTAVFGVIGYGSATSYVGEVLYYNRVLASNEYQSVEGYLAWKWGIKSSLPAIHPFYSTPAFSRPFGPTDIPGCALWYDAADASSITLNGSTVSKWSDKSGNGNHLTQGTTSAQPTYGTYLSYPGVYFNGANTQVLSTTYNQTGTGGRNTFIVFYDISTSPNIYGDPGLMYMGGSVAVGSAWRTQYIATSDALCVDIGAGVKIMTTSPNVTSMRTTRCVAMWAAPNSATVATTYVYGNGTQFTVQGANSGGLTTAVNTVGGLGTTIGKSTTSVISEILHYSTELTASQRQQVEGYLAAKWGLLNNLPGKTLSPMNIPGCALWLDGADSSTLTGSSPVTAWKDKANGYSFTGSSTLATGIGGASGSCLQFNGTSSYFLFNNATAIITQPYTVFVIGNLTTSSGYQRIINGISAAGTDQNLFVGSLNSAIAVFTGNAAAWNDVAIVSPSTSTLNTWSLITSFVSNATMTPYINGTAYTVKTGSYTASSLVGMNIGGGLGATPTVGVGVQPWIGYIGEVIFYNKLLSVSERQSVENYLMSKWGISNVTTHPFKSIPPSTSQPPQFQEVTPGNWTRDWKPYLQSLAAANSSGVTVTTSTITGGATYITNGWAGGVLGPDGNIYFTPSNAANILKLNVTTGVTTNITGGATYTTGGWCGGVLAPNGNIYFIPQAATNFLVLNPTTGVTSNLTGGATYTSGGWAGGLVGPDGNIYCCPIGATNILKLNVSTGVTTNITGGATYTATGWVCGQVGPDGNIYFTPVYATNILKLDPLTGITTNITGGATIPSNGYRGGTLGLDGNIYSAPYTSANILKFSVSPPTVTTITGGATMSSAWQSGVLAADGNIYFLPNTSSSLIRLNTTTGVTTNITGGATYTSQGWIGGVLAPDGNIYSGPYFSSSILKITFSGLSQLPSLRYCLSPFANHF